MKHYLTYPKNYDEALAEKYNNGCGPGGWKGKLVPDTIYCISIKEPCKIHDFMYEVGKNRTQKERADLMFYDNLLKVIQHDSKWWNRWLNPFREVRAGEYFLAVLFGGKDAFNNKVEK